MHLSKRFRLATAGLLFVLAGCASEPPPRMAHGPTPGPVPAAAPHGGAIDPGLAAQASAFEAFTRKAGAIEPGFSGPGAVGAALQDGAGYEPRQLEAGMIAYAAVAALQEPAFVAAVRRQGRDLAGRLAADPDAAMELPGADAAAARANGALYRRGTDLTTAGSRVKGASYSVQRQAWSKARVPNAPARLAQVKRLGAGGYQREAGDTARLFAAVSEGGRRGGTSPVVARGVAVAALSALGRDGGALMSEPRSAMCVRMAKLNYHQCLASAGTHYEDIYCLGVHALAETGQCVVEATKPTRTRVAQR